MKIEWKTRRVCGGFSNTLAGLGTYAIASNIAVGG